MTWALVVHHPVTDFLSMIGLLHLWVTIAMSPDRIDARAAHLDGMCPIINMCSGGCLLVVYRRRPSPAYDSVPPPNEVSEARSVFISQLAARMTPRDLGYFLEEKLGEGSVIDPRIVTDRISRRSKGCVLSPLMSSTISHSPKLVLPMWNLLLLILFKKP
jgi:hypothetical protein